MKKILLSIFAVLQGLFGSPSQSRAEEPRVTNTDEHNAVYKRGTDLISPYMRLLGRERTIDDKGRREIEQGIRCLRAVVAYAPENWAAYWFLGKGYQALDDMRAARDAFKASYELQKRNPDVAREYASVCLDLGEFAEAIVATKHAISLSPKDAGLHANLALALLMEGKVEEARSVVEVAHAMNPSDEITMRLKKAIDDVATGRRKQPKTVSELENG